MEGELDRRLDLPAKQWVRAKTTDGFQVPRLPPLLKGFIMRDYHHIWCNYFLKDPNTCKMCDRLFKKYPMDKPVEEMMKQHFPEAIVRK